MVDILPTLKLELENSPTEPDGYEICEAENVSLEVKEIYDFCPDTSTLLEMWPERNRERCAVGFVYDAVNDSKAEQ